ncbi:MAG: hypothetical protein U0T75_03820 [Chitinophagales bacterium]
MRGQTVQLNGNASSAHGILSYTWAPDFHLSCTACRLHRQHDTTTRYVLIAMDGDSCLGYDSLAIEVIKNAVQYFIPTAFTPNADKLNDYLNLIFWVQTL